MEPTLLGLVAPSLVSTVNVVARTTSVVTKPFAAFLQNASGLDEATRPQAIEIADLRVRADTLQADLERRIRKTMELSGIDLDSPVRLTTSEHDVAIEVETNHPRRTVLEAALASDPSIATDFRRLAAVRKLLMAAEERPEFAEDFSGDPWQAIAAHASRADDRYEAVLQLLPATLDVRLQFE